MKHWQVVVIIGVIILGAFRSLTAAVYDPADFTGKWYSCEDGAPYLFHNGIIISEKYHVSVSEGEIFSGAYSCFGKDKLFLFVIDKEGVEQVHELQLRSTKDGDILCDVTDNEIQAVFSRSRR